MTLILALGATARLTRLVTSDRITQAPRDWILDRLNPDGLTAYLLTCRWCVSIYTSIPIAAIATLHPNSLWWEIPALALTASHATGLLTAMEDDN
jgi:hypothetical protein